jgi:tetratricopeptide (TPR) repeat protein
MKKAIVYILILGFTTISGLAVNVDSLYIDANNKYSAELYNDAVEDYLLIYNQGYESFELFFNLGNAYFKLDDIPSALLYFEKAKKLKPNEEDVQYNINVANTHIIDKIEPVPELFFKRWWKSIVHAFSFDTWAKIMIISFILFFVLLSFYLLSRRILIRKAAFYSGLIVLTITLFSFVVSFQNYNIVKNHKAGIIFTPTITVKSSPNQNSVDLFVIHEGLKVSFLQKVSGWYEIKIANGSVGWIPASALKEI